MVSRIWRMGESTVPARFSGQRASSDPELGSSMFTEMRSASRPRASRSSGEAPGMALAWM